MCIKSTSLCVLYFYFYDNFCDSISCNMEINEMSSCGLYMCFIREFYIVFIKINMPFLFNTSNYFMLIDSAKNFPIFSLQRKFDLLPVEKFLYFIAFFEFDSSLILCFFFFFFYLLHSISSNLSGKSFWYEHISSLTARYLDDFPFMSDMSNIGEKLYGEKICRHMVTI